VLGEKGRRIRELTNLVQKRFNFQPDSLEVSLGSACFLPFSSVRSLSSFRSLPLTACSLSLSLSSLSLSLFSLPLSLSLPPQLYAEKVPSRGLSAIAQCESLRYKLLGGLAVRRACYGVLRFVMESGARGCEVVVSGKLRAQRAKGMKFADGFMKHAGNATRTYVQQAIRHVFLRQGMIGLKVKILLPHDPSGKGGPAKAMPDNVNIMEPKQEYPVTTPRSEVRTAAQQAAAPVPV
jgi:ribosomal protein S3